MNTFIRTVLKVPDRLLLPTCPIAWVIFLSLFQASILLASTCFIVFLFSFNLPPFPFILLSSSFSWFLSFLAPICSLFLFVLLSQFPPLPCNSLSFALLNIPILFSIFLCISSSRLPPPPCPSLPPPSHCRDVRVHVHTTMAMHDNDPPPPPLPVPSLPLKVVSELKNTVYRPKLSLLGSRDQLCVHEEVSQMKGPAKNHACSALASARRCKYHRGTEGMERAGGGSAGGGVLDPSTVRGLRGEGGGGGGSVVK